VKVLHKPLEPAVLAELVAGAAQRAGARAA
jgi:hypothetical protein